VTHDNVDDTYPDDAHVDGSDPSNDSPEAVAEYRAATQAAYDAVGNDQPLSIREAAAALSAYRAGHAAGSPTENPKEH
jgi:hypothetical protein